MKHIIILIAIIATVNLKGQEVKVMLSMGHTKPVTNAYFSPDGKYVVTSSSGSAKVWDVETGKLLRDIDKQKEVIALARFSPDGKKFVTFCINDVTSTYSLIIWDFRTGELLHQIIVDLWPEFIEFSQDGKKLVLYNRKDKELWIFNVETGNKICDIKENNYVSFSPNGEQIITKSSDTIVRVLEIKTGKFVQELKGITKNVRNAQFTMDGKKIVVEQDSIGCLIWDLNTGNNINNFFGNVGLYCSNEYNPSGEFNYKSIKKGFVVDDYNTVRERILKNCKDSIVAKYFNYIFPIKRSPDGERILFSDSYEKTYIFDVKSGNLVSELKGINYHVFRLEFEFSFDGKRVLMSDEYKEDSIKIWDVETGELIIDLPRGTDVFFSPDGKKILILKPNNIGDMNIEINKEFPEILNAENGKLLQKLSGHDQIYFSVKFSPDRSEIVVSSKDKNSYIIDVNTGKIIHTLKGHNHWVWDAKYSPNGKRIVTASRDSTAKIWDAETGSLLFDLKGHNAPVVAEYTSDGKKILTFYYMEPDIAKIWDAETGDLLYNINEYLYEIKENTEGEELIKFFNKDTNIWDLGTVELLNKNIANFSPDAKKIVTGGKGKVVKLWDVESGKLLYKLNEIKEYVSDVKFSPDGNKIMTIEDELIEIWDVTNGELKNRFEYSELIYSAIFSKDSKMIIVTDLEFRNAKLWDIETSKLICSIDLGGGIIKTVDWDSMYVVIGNAAKITLFDLKKCKEIISWIQLDSANFMVYHNMGYFDGTKAAIEKLYFVKDLEIIPVENYFEQFYRPNLWQRVMKGEEIEKASIDFQNQKPTPEIKITNPSSGKIDFRGDVKIDISTNKIDFLLEYTLIDRGGGINEIMVFQNGKLVHNSLETINQKEQSIQRSYTLKLLSGINTIKVTAFNNDRIEKSETTVIEYTGKDQEPAKLYVLAIGINEYQKSSYNLNYAVPDVNSFKVAIDKGAKDIFAEVIIKSIQNGEATKYNILKAIKEIQTKCNQGDVFVFYYAGHGSMSVVNEGEQSVFYLIPHEITNLYSDEILKKYGISASELQDFSKGINAQKQLYILDACQSGGAVNVLANRGAIEEKAMALLARSTGTYFLTASGSEQLAGEFASLGHGVFTFAILEGLSGLADANKDDKISIKELSLYVENKVPELSEKYKGNSQFPVSYGFGQDFPLVINGKFIINESNTLPEGKYSGYSIEELGNMKKEAVEKEEFDLAKELKNEIERRSNK